MMSFKSRDLMTDVLPPGKPFAHPGFALCGEATRDEEDAGDCGEATRQPEKLTTAPSTDLAALRGQLRQALSERRV
jgi:hypothetical protein